jgi:hypothetical protein
VFVTHFYSAPGGSHISCLEASPWAVYNSTWNFSDGVLIHAVNPSQRSILCNLSK